MSLVRSVLPGAYAAKARGVVLCAMTIGTGYVYYLAFDANDAIPPAAADAIVLPPIVEAQPINAPMHVIPDDAQHQLAAAAKPDQAEITRELQSALTRARCYDGPINGRWTAASQQAASAFLVAVDDKFPVGDPEPALLSLVAANANATCPLKTPLYAGALAAQETKSRAEERSMLDRPWAPPEMLVPPKPTISPAASVTTPLTISDAEPFEHDPPRPSTSIAASQELSSPVASVTQVRLAPSKPALHFDGNVVSDTAPDTNVQPPPTPKAAQRKPKSAKRRASRRHDDADFGVSFDSIQKSLSSLF